MRAAAPAQCAKIWGLEKPAKPTGWYRYAFRFTLQASAEVELSAERVEQGGIVGLRISGMTGDAAPTVETDLGNVQCVRAADGWRAYIPAAYNASSGGHEVNITVNGETITRSIIVLPKDFSTSLVESVTGTSKQPKIKYYVNEKKNAIAPKITDTGATTIDEQINSAFVTTVATTVASAVSEAGGDLDQATGKVQHDTINDLNTVMSTLNTVQDSLTDLQDTLAQSDTILADAKQTTASLKQTVAAAQKASRQSGTLLTETQAGSQAFSTTLVGALDTSSAQLSGLAVHVNNAAGSITGSFNSAQNSVDTITNTLSAPLNATQTSISDLKDALTKAGIGKDTTDPVGQNIWKQIDALDSLISKQQTQLNTFHTDTTQFINSGKDATTNLSGAMTNTTTGASRR